MMANLKTVMMSLLNISVHLSECPVMSITGVGTGSTQVLDSARGCPGAEYRRGKVLHLDPEIFQGYILVIKTSFQKASFEEV